MSMRTPEQRTRDEARIEQVLLGSVMPISEAWHHTKVVGVTASNPDGSSRQDAIAKVNQFDFVDLVRNPHDPWDKNAVMVMASIMDPPSRCAGPNAQPTMSRVQLGHLDAKLASEIAPLLDAGEPWAAIVTQWRARLPGEFPCCCFAA